MNKTIAAILGRLVETQQYFWVSKGGMTPPAPGFVVPPFRPERDGSEPWKDWHETERILEGYRKKHYPSELSRIGCVFVTDNAGDAAKWQRLAARDGVVHKVSVEGRVSGKKDGSVVSALMNEVRYGKHRGHDNWTPEVWSTYADDICELYWSGGLASEPPLYDSRVAMEIIVQGKVTVIE